MTRRLLAELLAFVLVCPPACFGLTTALLRWTAPPAVVTVVPNQVVQHYPVME